MPDLHRAQYVRGCREPPVEYPNSSSAFPHDDDRVDPQHAERIVQDTVHPAQIARLVGDNLSQVALGVDCLEVDCSVCDSIVKGWKIPEELERPGRSHRVSDKAFRVIDGD